MTQIIAFAGRLASGKTELASICEQYGYKKLYFAQPLKQLCADILNITIEELNVLKRNNENINLFVDDNIIKFIYEKTEIPHEEIKKIIGHKTINNVRELLQVVGTDVIRKYNNNWHVEQIKNMIQNDNKYVIDDVRFPNEKEMIEQLGGTCWFIIRPTLKNVSNHISENSLCWREFTNIIVNDDTIDMLLQKWDMFMNHGYDKSLKKRNELMLSMNTDNKNSIDVEKCVVKVINEKPLFLNDILFIHEDFFKYKQTYVIEQPKEIFEENNCVFIKNKQNIIEKITNVFEIEDLKKFL